MDYLLKLPRKDVIIQVLSSSIELDSATSVPEEITA